MTTYKFPSAPPNSGSLLPKEARSLLRTGEYYGTTAGFCLGYTQANLVVLPAQYADGFQKFCLANSAAFPLLYCSKPGEVTASPELAEDSDVRIDIPRYLIFSHGRQVDDMRDVLGFQWNNLVSFYIGCSFTFEDTLINNGVSLRYVKEGKGVSMYATNLKCYHGDNKDLEGCQMVVSMRPIGKDVLQKAVHITAGYPKAHGAPVHIGDPAKIGIFDLNNIDCGDLTIVGEDEVPVFWACGVTGKRIVECLKTDIAFTHYPGSMFITDLPATPIQLTDITSPLVVPISPPRFPFYASLVSKKRAELIRQLEEVILYDPGDCKVASLRTEGDFLKSIVVLSHCQSVGVVFGFPCNREFECMEESDGPPGALAIAKALQCLGKKVVIISEERNRAIVESSVELMVEPKSMKSKIKFKSCGEVLVTKGAEFDCLVAIERVGRAKDGSHYSMKGVDLGKLIDPIDNVFVEAMKSDSIITIGIGDRGNELGLGRVWEKAKDVLGEEITCDVAADYAILAGVSNWGGYALGAGLYLLATCPVHWRYSKYGINGDEIEDWDIDGFLPTEQEVEAVLKHVNGLGVRDGISKSLDQSVDGIPLKTHQDVVQKMRLIATS